MAREDKFKIKEETLENFKNDVKSFYNLLSPVTVKFRSIEGEKNSNVIYQVHKCYIDNVVSGEKIIDEIGIYDEDTAPGHGWLYNTAFQKKLDESTSYLDDDYWTQSNGAKSKEDVGEEIKDFYKEVCGQKQDLKRSFSINVLRTAGLTTARAKTSETEFFLNHLPSTVVASMVPYFDIEFQIPNTEDKKHGKKRNLNKPSLIRFLLGSLASKNNVPLTDADFSLLSPVDTPTKDDKTAQSYFIGMEMFTTPQTLTNMETLTATPSPQQVTRLVDVKPFLPPASVTNASIQMLNAGAGKFAHKKADVELKIHDKFRLSEFSEFLRGPAGYASVTVWLTYGWLAPRNRGEDDNYAKFINQNMLVREAFTLKNSSFSFDASGQVSVKIELVSKGIDTIEKSVISIADPNNVNSKIYEVQRLLRDIKKNRSAFGEVPEGAQDIRIYQILDAAEKGDTEFNIPSQELTNIISKAKAAVAGSKFITNKSAAQELLKSVESIFMRQGESRYTNAQKYILDEVTSFSKDRFDLCASEDSPDPFLPDASKNAPGKKLFSDDLLRAMKDQGSTKGKDGAYKGSSVGQTKSPAAAEAQATSSGAAAGGGGGAATGGGGGGGGAAAEEEDEEAGVNSREIWARVAAREFGGGSDPKPAPPKMSKWNVANVPSQVFPDLEAPAAPAAGTVEGGVAVTAEGSILDNIPAKLSHLRVRKSRKKKGGKKKKNSKKIFTIQSTIKRAAPVYYNEKFGIFEDAAPDLGIDEDAETDPDKLAYEKKKAEASKAKLKDIETKIIKDAEAAAAKQEAEKAKKEKKQIPPAVKPGKPVVKKPVRRKIVSFGKIFSVFCLPALIEAADQEDIDEVQVNFYQINESCGPVSLHNIAEFPIDIDDFEKQFADYAMRRGGEQMTVQEFVRFVAETQFADNRAPGYGMRSYYEPYDANNPEEKKAGDDASFNGKITEWFTKYGSLKKPNIAVKMETKSSETSKDSSDLLFKLASTVGSAYANPEDVGKSKGKIKKVHIYDKQHNPFADTAKVLKQFDGSYLVYDGPQPDEVSEKARDNAIKTEQKLKDFIEETYGVTKSIAPGINVLRDFVSNSVPTLIVGANGTLIKDCSLSSKADGLIGTNNMQGGSFKAKSTLAPNGLSMAENNLPMRIIPAQLTMNTFGCPIADLYQSYFIDFGTGTTIDNIYSCIQLNHTFGLGKFETSWTFTYLDGYSRFFGAPNLFGAIKEVEETASGASGTPPSAQKTAPAPVVSAPAYGDI